MASFRRTMSVVQRDGGAQNGEAFTISSESPKPSYAQSYHPSSRSLATFFGSMDILMLLYRIRALILGICSQRSPRPLERSMLKGPIWKRTFFHFFVFFMAGIFVGFTPFVLVDFSSSLISKTHPFSFEVNHPIGNVDQYVNMVRNRTHLFEKIEFKENASIGKGALQKPVDDIADAPSASSSFRDVDFVYQKLLIIVTATYARPFQAYYMNRLAHTLRLVPPPLLWVVVEMSAQSAETAEILRKTGVMYRHLVCEKNITSIKNRGVHQRNAALSHIEKHRLDGIVYFADDDYIYSLDLFKQMREIRRFGTWPVAMLTESKNKAILEGPVCNSSQVIGWHTNERSQRTRRFYADMSGFAFNSTILWDPKRWRRPTLDTIRQLDTVKEGFQETTFIEQVVEDESQMECLPKNISRIMVWHLHLETSKMSYPRGWLIPKNLDVVIPLM